MLRPLLTKLLPMSTQPALSCPPLTVDKVTKRFGSLTAVDAVNLTIEPGEIFALLGPNGAGKTTLINCIAGLARQSSGEIRVFGFDNLRDFRTTRRLVGLVPQEINFDPFFTPLESLLNQMGFMGVPPDEARAERLLETFALTEQRNAYTRTLSGGMKRRLLVAKALAHRPKLLFLDEPTAGVDVNLRRDLWREVRRLRDEGTTIILTTHYLDEAESLADRIGVIHLGRLILLEDKDALMRRYRQAQVSVELDCELAERPEGLPEGAKLEGRRIVAPWSCPADLEAVLSTARRVSTPVDVRLRETALEDIFVGLIASAEERAKAEESSREQQTENGR